MLLANRSIVTRRKLSFCRSYSPLFFRCISLSTEFVNKTLSLSLSFSPSSTSLDGISSVVLAPFSFLSLIPPTGNRAPSRGGGNRRRYESRVEGKSEKRGVVFFLSGHRLQYCPASSSTFFNGIFQDNRSAQHAGLPLSPVYYQPWIVDGI